MVNKKCQKTTREYVTQLFRNGKSISVCEHLFAIILALTPGLLSASGSLFFEAPSDAEMAPKKSAAAGRPPSQRGAPPSQRGAPESQRGAKKKGGPAKKKGGLDSVTEGSSAAPQEALMELSELLMPAHAILDGCCRATDAEAAMWCWMRAARSLARCCSDHRMMSASIRVHSVALAACLCGNPATSSQRSVQA